MRLEGKQNILIYRDHLLAPSETFIKAQAEGLQTFRSHYIGSRPVQGAGLELAESSRWLVNTGGALGKAKEIGFKLSGFSWGMTRRLSALNPQLLHAHFGPDGVLALPIAERLNLPLVVTFHGYDVTTSEHYAKKSYFTHRNYLRKRHLLQERGDLFIAISDFIHRKLIHQGYPEDKIVRHYIGVDTNKFQPDDTVKRKPVVLFVGRLVEVKGCAYLIQAMQTVQQLNRDAELVVIGDGPLRSQLEQVAARTLRKYRFLGVQPQSVVKQWMNQAKVFCVPSITAASGAEEGLGMVFLEASAMGVPVVSFATGGIPEAVKHFATGFLARERDWRGLAEYIAKLLEDDALWQVLSRRGRQRIQEMFDLNKQTAELERLYTSLLAGQTREIPELMLEDLEELKTI